jgi:protein TonB
MTAAFLHRFMPYGAPDLLDAARPNLARALAGSSAAACLLFAAAWSVSLVLARSEARSIPIVIAPHQMEQLDHVVLPPPPPVITVAVTPAPLQRAVAAVPVPVPETAAPDNTTVMDQSQLGTAIGPGATSGAKIDVPPGPGGPVNQPGRVAIVDQLAEAVHIVQPHYPDIALQAQVEGLVMVYARVGKDGRVLEVKLDSRLHVPLLDETALDAVRRWVFTPAIDHDRPVEVWVNVPIRFSIHD